MTNLDELHYLYIYTALGFITVYILITLFGATFKKGNAFQIVARNRVAYTYITRTVHHTQDRMINNSSINQNPMGG